MKKPNLVVTLRGGCSVPMSEIAQLVLDALESVGLQASIEEPDKTDTIWEYGYDGETEDEVALVKYEWGTDD